MTTDSDSRCAECGDLKPPVSTASPVGLICRADSPNESHPFRPEQPAPAAAGEALARVRLDVDDVTWFKDSVERWRDHYENDRAIHVPVVAGVLLAVDARIASLEAALKAAVFDRDSWRRVAERLEREKQVA